MGSWATTCPASVTQTAPRRAHSIAAQGWINAAKNYQNDGDSVHLLFYDTVKGGDYRARESNVHRLSEVSVEIIDQCAAQGVPFAREYGGLLANRSFGGAQVSRTFYARGQTGQQLLLGCYSALSRQIDAGTVKMYPRHEMLELIVVDGRARGIVTRNLVNGEIKTHIADCVILGTGGYGNVFYLSTNAMASNATAVWRAHRQGAYFANPCYTQIHPTCIPVKGSYQSKLTLMSESLRNDGRVWVPKDKDLVELPAREIGEDDRDYYLERRYPAFGNLVPRDVASRAAKKACDEGLGVGHEIEGERRAVYLDFADAIERLVGASASKSAMATSSRCTTTSRTKIRYEVPMRIYPAVHYTMGGLWVDYNLMSNLEGLFVIGEANFSDHGANRLGASALMQGLADGYFIVPYTVGNYLARVKPGQRSQGRIAQASRREGGAQARQRSGRATARGGRRPHRGLVPSRARTGVLGRLRPRFAPERASKRASRRSSRCARSSGRACVFPAPGSRSTWSWRRRAAWRTSSSSAS